MIERVETFEFLGFTHFCTRSRKWGSFVIGRKTSKRYVLSHEQVLTYYSDYLVHHQPIEGVFSAALGNYGYLVRSPKLDEIIDISKEALEKLP